MTDQNTNTLTPKQAAAMIRMTSQTIRNHIAAGTLTASPTGKRGHYVIHYRDFIDFCVANNYHVDRSPIARQIHMLQQICASCPHIADDLPE